MIIQTKKEAERILKEVEPELQLEPLVCPECGEEWFVFVFEKYEYDEDEWFFYPVDEDECECPRGCKTGNEFFILWEEAD
ncbi:hypothetical protein [Kroppenstedtia sanguinis]|uniref:Uncharacterized protein n=1 Tax=Kroppenstedtia sanguinis TaxID=1380684 RepID=A0ABW4CEV7_9BACL